MHLYSSNAVSCSEEVSHEGSKLSGDTENHNFIVFGVPLDLYTNLLENCVDSISNGSDHHLLANFSMSLLLVFGNTV